MGQNGGVCFTNRSNELHHVLYSTRIDLHLDSEHHFPPGSWPWSPGAPGGANDTYVISTRDEHGSVICKASRDACGDSLRAHTKFQRSIRPSWRVVVLFPSFWPGGPRPMRGGGEMMKVPYLLATTVDSTSVTCHIIVK